MGTDDLHLITGANNLGTPIASVTTDIDGDVRSTTTPDIGADEYYAQFDDARIAKIIWRSRGLWRLTLSGLCRVPELWFGYITSMGATVK